MPYTMTIYQSESCEIPQVSDLFRVTATRTENASDAKWSNTRIMLEKSDKFPNVYNTACKIVGQLHAELADACAARDALARECNQLEADREYNASLVMERDRELARLREQLTTKVQRCGYCDYGATGVDAFNLVAEHIKSCPGHPLAGALAELAQARRELGCLQGASREYGRQLTAAKENRDYWYETCLSAEGDLTRARQEMQAQADLSARAQADLDAEPIEVEITGQEMVEALQAERRLRQEAERVCEAMSEMARERGERLDKAERERNDISKNLKRMVELNGWSRNELDRVNQRAAHAEARLQERACLGSSQGQALAQLVNEETAGLLKRLADFASHGRSWYDDEYGKDPQRARDLAAKIKEVLDR